MLTEIQDLAFVHKVDLYARVDTDSEAEDFVGQTATKVALYKKNVRCRLVSKQEISKPGSIGRFNKDILETTDVLRLSDKEVIQDGMYAQLNVPGHPSNGTWYAMLGETQSRSWQGKEILVSLKRSIKPPM